MYIFKIFYLFLLNNILYFCSLLKLVMNKEFIREILLDQKEMFNNKHPFIERQMDLQPYLKTGQVVIISGVRRCGKSSLLFLIKEKLKLKEEDYCYVNFDDERFPQELSLLDKIYNTHIEMYGKEPVLFFDEIQQIEGWERFINRIYERGRKVFVTGSNARLLSSEISTSLTGRNMVLHLYPFSFSEYLDYKKARYNPSKITPQQKALLQKDLNHYVQYGGFPLVLRENTLELLNSYFQDILYRDIIARYRLSQVNEIKEIGLYLASNVGKLFSYSTLQAISGIKSTSSVKDYLHYYEQSYLFFYLKKFDFSIKKQIMNPKKAYTIDSAFSHRIGFNFSENKGRVIENIIFIELLRRGKEVYYFSGKNECDFLVKEGTGITEAIQVSYWLDETNLKRELDGLREAMKKFNLLKGILLVYEENEKINIKDEQIQVVPIWKWLLSN